ncbi:diacylglycerol kinase family protein [Rhizobium sp. RU36D]|uniref:diacylglycerol/lipid kinase family protein n=1 Tax=Rhizobium sp. RU36D TaxID=1907415 RepID=UPI0009D7E843|nr:diacylglycerol kinase family protein [Rhizobium sp. RU36D]SMC90965.1 transcriptional regulator [Rhizobium sp. RU36D]
MTAAHWQKRAKWGHGVKTGVVRNPVAGGLSARRRWRATLKALRQVFPALELHETKKRGDGIRLGRELADAAFDLVIAVGGDGTISEVAAGILSSSRPQTELSFVPLGSGSDFSRNFALPRDAEGLAAHIAKAVARPVDAGILLSGDGTRPERAFVNIASIGVSGTIVRAANQPGWSRFAGGSLHFLFHSLREIARYKPAQVRVKVDGKDVFSGPVVCVVCANGGWFGGGMHVMPMAEFRDGLMDCGILRFTSRLGLVRLMQKFYSAAHLTDPNASFHRGRNIEIVSIGSNPALVEADGEQIGEHVLNASIRPAALQLRM